MLSRWSTKYHYKKFIIIIKIRIVPSAPITIGTTLESIYIITITTKVMMLIIIIIMVIFKKIHTFSLLIRLNCIIMIIIIIINFL